MRTLAIALIVAVCLAPAVVGQTKSPGTTPDAAAEAKFKAADKNGNSTLEGAELEAHKSVLAQVDTDKDGKLSRSEFLAGAKAGHIK
jgi:EF hand